LVQDQARPEGRPR